MFRIKVGEKMGVVTNPLKSNSKYNKNHYLFFIGSMGAGGAERVISLLTKKLSQNPDNEIELIIYYDKTPFYELDDRVKVISLQKETGSKNIVKNLMCLRSHFKKHDGVVLSFLAPFNILAMIAHAGLKTPIIVADRNDPRKIPSNTFVRKIRDFLYRFADAVVVQTKRNKEYFSKAVQSKSTVIYNPINLGDKAGLALKTEKKNQIVTVARLMPQKNHKLLIDAFSNIAEGFANYELVFYGDGPEKEKLDQYIREKNLSQKIFLPGNITNVPETIAEATLFVLPSDYEGMPNALMEAMCVGLPVISTKVSGATDLINDGVNGILVDVGDVEGITTAIKAVLTDKQLRTRLENNAIALNEFLAVEKIINEWSVLISKHV